MRSPARWAGLLAAVLASAVAAQPPAFDPPSPTGRFPIGTTAWVVTDTSRPETFAPGPRQVRVVAWYPATEGAKGARAPYLRESGAEVQSFASLIRQPGAFDGLLSVLGHGLLDVAPAGRDRLPVLIFSHGYTAIPSSHTVLLEDLASHGYAVLSVVHPYEATAATRADGTVVTLLDAKEQMRQGIRDVVGEWGPEDETMAKVTRAATDAERLELIRGYLGNLTRTHAALAERVADVRTVLDRLSSLPASSAAGRLAARLDLARLGVFGHSMGGVTAGQFCVDDPRCRAGLNLDGIPQYGTMIDRRMNRPFVMVYSGRAGRAGASDVVYRAAASTYYRVDVRDTLHVDFTDMNFWATPLGARGAFGAITPVRAAALTRRIVREFFDQELGGTASPLLAGKAVLPEVTVKKGSDPF
ncbi:MAG: alpha/beta hydrolase family protein [Acidobacteriota bacterium]